MQTFSLRIGAMAVAAVAGWAPAGSASDPVVVDLLEQATTRTAVVTVEGVARVSGGDPATRDRVARLDVVELKARKPSATVSRRVVEFRLQLAGFEPGEVVLRGADRVTVTAARRTVTVDEVVSAARTELLHQLPLPPETVSVELARPVAARLPDVLVADSVAVASQPHNRVVGPGRVQMDTAISAGGERLLALAIHFEVKQVDPATGRVTPTAAAPAPGGRAPEGGGAATAAGNPAAPPAGPVVPAGATAPATRPAAVPPRGGATPPASAEVLVRARQRVTMVVRLAGASVTAVGEAQQDGRLGQTIQVQNVDSKKLISGRVSGSGVVEVELGGVP